MNALCRKETGQSIPLIALMIVVLFGMVGLAVDVGNTYAEQRTAQRATNAAAVAAMDAVIKGYQDPGVAQVIRESLTTNGLQLQSQATDEVGNVVITGGNRRIVARYMDVSGRPISVCEIGNCGSVPPGVNFVEVGISGEVDTYFAKVIGQKTLPVNSNSFAARCPPTEGVYPIAVSTSDLDLASGAGFKSPTANGASLPPGVSMSDVYGTYKDSNFPAGKPWRRLYLRSNPSVASGSFSFLRWQDSQTGSSALATALSGSGTLKNGFTEAPHPSNGDAIPAGYPLAPGQLTLNDWVWGNTSQSWSGGDAVYSALTKLMNDRTMVMLPVIGKEFNSGGGNQALFQLSTLGMFYIVDAFPGDASKGGVSSSGGSGAYIDLVYLGPVNEVACLVTTVDPVPGEPNVEQPDLTVRVPFAIQPKWREGATPEYPVAYQLVVDVSGSMSHNWAGYGTIGGRDYLCEYGSRTPENINDYNDTCRGGPNSSWKNVNERRIYVMKQAIRSFIDGLGPYDKMRYTAFSNSGMYSGNVKTVPTTFTDDKALLQSELDKLGALDGDPYRTQGGTPGPQALAKARDVIASVPPAAANGLPFRKVVIYLTDGVANVKLNGQGVAQSPYCPGYSEQQTRNDPKCQTGPGMPITQMIEQADLLRAADEDVKIYVVAMAGVATDGLYSVASDGLVFPANNPGSVGSILSTIRNIESSSTCLPKQSRFQDYINGANHGVGIDGAALPSDVYGKVKIYSENGEQVIPEQNVVHDTSGKLWIEFKVPPGKYQIDGWLSYKGPDGLSRIYNGISRDGGATQASRTEFEVQPNTSLNDVRVINPTMYMMLETGKQVCPLAGT